MMIGIVGILLMVLTFTMGFVTADIGNETAYDQGWSDGAEEVIRMLPAEYVRMLAEDDGKEDFND